MAQPGAFATPADIRRELESLIAADLLGPAGVERESLTDTRERVSARYLVGMLAPCGTVAFDPLCAEHTPDESEESLHTASCHACLFVPGDQRRLHRRARMDAALAFRALADRAQVYVWPLDKRPAGVSSLLHAKVVVADAQLAFISSANLTGSGLEHNLEMGILIHGGAVPQRTAEHFRSLIASRVLRPASA